MRYIIIVISIFSSLQSLAQNDTVFIYTDRSGAPVAKDSAFVVKKIFHSDGLWKKQDVLLTGQLLAEESYKDAERKIRSGTWSWFNENGIMIGKEIYRNNERVEQFLFHKDGKLYMHAIFNDQRVLSVKGFDSDGKEIPGFIYKQEGQFPGGERAWQRFIKKTVSKNQPVDYKNGKMYGNVLIGFKITVDGKVTEPYIAQSSGYKELDMHALNAIQSSPDWLPEILYNHRSSYWRKQLIVYHRKN